MQINTSFLVLYQIIQRKNESLSLTRNMSSILHHQEWKILSYCSVIKQEVRAICPCFAFLRKKKNQNQHNTPLKNLRTRIGWSRHLDFKLCFSLCSEGYCLWKSLDCEGSMEKLSPYLHLIAWLPAITKALSNPNLRQVPYPYCRNVTTITAGKWV